MFRFFASQFSLGRPDQRNALWHAVGGWRRHPILWTGSVPLLFLSAAWIVMGYNYLLVHPYAVDLEMRWVEQRYVYNGQNPYDVVELVSALRDHRPLPECTRDNRVDPGIGPPYHRSGGYPPWAFPTTALFVLPTQFRFTRIYFGVLDALALAITFVWAYHIGRRHSRAGGVFLGAAALAIFGHCVALRVGQYSILVNILLVGMYVLVERQKPVLAGIAYGMAALKPQISALFALIFLVRRQWKSLAAATAYLVIASLVTWAFTKTDPLEMLTQMQALAHRWTYHPDAFNRQLDVKLRGPFPQGYSSFSTLLMQWHVDWTIATSLGAVLGLLTAALLLWFWRNSSTLSMFAVAATLGRLWSYHLPYDDVMLIFLVAALGERVLTRPSIWSVLALSLVGISLWTPMRGWGTPYPLPFQIAQISSWLFGLTVLLASQPRFSRRDDKSKLPRVTQDDLPVATVAGLA
jgi:hypothetical protein